MDLEAFREAMREIGQKGGFARAKAMTAEERRKSATKASKAAARARTAKAKERRKETAKKPRAAAKPRRQAAATNADAARERILGQWRSNLA